MNGNSQPEELPLPRPAGSNCISLGSATSSAITGEITAGAVIADIQSGKWATQIEAVRAAEGEEADRLKKYLPAILWTGIFTTRRNDGITKFSGYLCADIDKVPDRVQQLRETARQDQHAAAAFISPSGKGIKIVFRVPEAASPEQHRRNFDAIRAHVAGRYGAKVDEAAKDVARLCFVSHDPEAFFKAQAVPLEVNGEPEPEDRPPQDGGMVKGNRNNAAFARACQCRDLGLEVEEARALVQKFAAQCQPPLPADEADTCVRSAFSQPARPLVAKLPDLIDAADFLAQTINPPAELVAGLLYQGSKLVFGGSSKSCKTWCLLDLGISVANGVDWFGRKTTKGKVLYVNFEIQPHAWQRRIKAVAKAKGVTINHGDIQIWNLRGHAASFRELIPRIIERAKMEGFVLIILDPIYKLYGDTDENAAGEVAKLFNSLETLAVETGAAIAFGAHFAKGKASAKEPMDRISGSGVFARDPDSILVFTKHEAEDAFTVEAILREFPPAKPFAVRWQFPTMQLAPDLDPAKLKKNTGRPVTHTPDKLLALLPSAGLTHREWLDRAAAAKISDRTYHRLRDDLEKAGKIVENKASGLWLPVPREKET